MEKFTVNFDVRWSDIDANRHMANSAYQNFMSHARMGFLAQVSIGIKEMSQDNIGAVIFNEVTHYFKEIHLGMPITVSCEMTGISDDGSLFRFEHNFYNHTGKNMARGIMNGAWMDLNKRKLTALPDSWMNKINNHHLINNLETLTMDMVRGQSIKPINL